jgi:DNA-binding CsgD family transcriptional regulator
VFASIVEIVGRDAEHQRLLEFIDRAPAGPAALVLEGEPGIGKTLLWLAAIEAARTRGALVLETRPTEEEAALSFIGLHDLLEAVGDAAIAALAVPQRRAIQAALHRSGAPDSPADQAAVAVGVLNLVRGLADHDRLVIAIDDEPWLDPPSASVLAIAIRRLRDEDVRLVVTRRTGESTALGIAGAIPDEAVMRITLQPLPLGALHHLIRTRLDLSLPRPALVRLHEITQGNPLYGLELARLFGTGVVAPDVLDRGIPADLQELLSSRLANLSESSRRTIVAAALTSRPTPSLLARVQDVSEDEVATDLEEAQRAGILAWRNDRIEFSHPLLASAARSDMPAGTRRRLHRAFATLVGDPEQTAFHLAEASEGEDETVASALETAGRIALERGAVITAVDLRQRAVDRTPGDGPARARRVVQLADALFTSGDTGQAHRLLSAVLPRLDESDVRAEAALLLATIVWFDGDSRDAAEIAEAALAATSDIGWKAKLHSRLAWIYEFDVGLSTKHAQAAMQLIDPEDEPALFAFALLTAAQGELQLGRRADHEAIARGHALQERARLWEFSTLPANWAKWMDDFGRSRELTELYLGRSRLNGDDSSVAQLLGYLAELECWTGHLDLALAYADEALGTAEQTDQPVFLAAGLARRAAILALRGMTEEARAEAEAALGVAERVNSPLLVALARGTLASIALVRDDVVEADRQSTLASAALLDGGDRIQPAFRFHADQIEAVIALGDLDRAEELIGRQEARGNLGPVPWALATAARCRALLSAAHGDLGAALDHVNEALDHHDHHEMPIELGRTLLVAGRLRRRAGKRRDAGQALDRAAAIFETAGASTWLERTRLERDRLGLQRGDGRALTPSEERIARMAAQGLTNRAVASRLSISPKTVEANLARVYGKLGIHSRAELGSVVARLDDDTHGSSPNGILRDT